MCNLNQILKNLDDVKAKGKINVYALKNVHKPVKDSYAVALPSNINKEFLEEYCKTIYAFESFSCVKFDALEHKDNTYEYIELAAVDCVWNKFNIA